MRYMVPMYIEFEISWVPIASFVKFVGAMAPTAPILTHPLILIIEQIFLHPWPVQSYHHTTAVI